MAVFSPQLSMNIEVRARLIGKGNDKPVHGKPYKVKLYDKEFFDDDFLGESALDANGYASIIFNPAQLYRKEPIRDRALDFHFVVFKNGKEIFRSKVMKDADPDYFEQLNMGEGEIIELGTFLIEP